MVSVHVSRGGVAHVDSSVRGIVVIVVGRGQVMSDVGGCDGVMVLVDGDGRDVAIEAGDITMGVGSGGERGMVFVGGSVNGSIIIVGGGAVVVIIHIGSICCCYSAES
jgi:hypothetical protein